MIFIANSESKCISRLKDENHWLVDQPVEQRSLRDKSIDCITNYELWVTEVFSIKSANQISLFFQKLFVFSSMVVLISSLWFENSFVYRSSNLRGITHHRFTIDWICGGIFPILIPVEFVVQKKVYWFLQRPLLLRYSMGLLAVQSAPMVYLRVRWV